MAGDKRSAAALGPAAGESASARFAADEPAQREVRMTPEEWGSTRRPTRQDGLHAIERLFAHERFEVAALRFARTASSGTSTIPA